MRAPFDSFGRIDRHSRRAIDAALAVEMLRRPDAAAGSLLAYGNGRSYGDSCHNDSGTLVAMRPRNAIVDFDPETGIIEAEAGTRLDEIIARAAPFGFFLPVTPGTRFVTLGGAVANDVHGKNHHVRGTFGCHVQSLDLLRSDGVVYHCKEDENDALFHATIGGLGLTGLILTVRLRLMRVGSLDMEQQVIPFSSLDQYFDLAEDIDARNEYAVAWVDQLASASAAGRGVLIAGNHATNGNFRPGEEEARLKVPFELPFSALNGLSLRLFNTAYFHAKRRKSGSHRTHYRPFFYPLDGIGDWNRLYGPGGLYQHQSVIPFEAAARFIPAMLAASRKAGQASFLTVLKRFGTVRSPGLLSFPRPGYTLTMDFPNRGPSTVSLLDALDRMTIEAGGRINPYKDHRMSAAAFQAGFPEWQALERLRDRNFCSNFWRRVALRSSDDAMAT
jgi:FAD/FMN-containing dehydrogenase